MQREDGILEIGAGSDRDGGYLRADRFLRDRFSMEVLHQLEAEWFIPLMERMAAKDDPKFWDVSRGYELAKGTPIHRMCRREPQPHAWSGYRINEHYCRFYFSVSDEYYTGKYDRILTLSKWRRLGCPIGGENHWRAMIAYAVPIGAEKARFGLEYHPAEQPEEPSRATWVWEGKKERMTVRELWQNQAMRQQIEQEGVGWFLPLLERMAQGERVPMWKMDRGYELRHGEPMHLVPPA